MAIKFDEPATAKSSIKFDESAPAKQTSPVAEPTVGEKIGAGALGL